MINLNFNVCHQLANDYFYFHHQNKRSLPHNISCSYFIMWIYYNDDDDFNAYDELKIILRLSHEHELKKYGWDKNVSLDSFKVAQWEIFDIVVVVVFSPKKTMNKLFEKFCEDLEHKELIFVKRKPNIYEIDVVILSGKFSS